MSPTLHNFLAIDLMPLSAGILAAVTCGLLGNFLLLRRLSLMGDAISHSVLPGLVAAFLITGLRSPLPMFLGAAAAGIATVILVELVKKLGRVEPGAAMGVVFSILFALGVLLIEQAAARHIDLDADCVLYGNLENLGWYEAPRTLAKLTSWDTLATVPRQVVTLLVMAFFAVGFVTLLFKELRIAAFDAELATTQGFSSSVLHFLLMVFVAAATVAAFEAVGSILVVAMLICPAATARLLTDRLRPQILWSVAVSLAAGVLGYLGANVLPAAFNKPWSLNSAGGMTVVAGLLLVLAIVFSPTHGVLARRLRLRRLSGTVAMEDILAALFRTHEDAHAAPSEAHLATLLPGRAVDRGLALAASNNFIRRGERLVLTEAGEAAARDLVRRHRLWETYLVSEAGLAPDHVHPTAELLEHTPIRPEPDSGTPATDPHGKRIPSRDGPDSKP